MGFAQINGNLSFLQFRRKYRTIKEKGRECMHYRFLRYPGGKTKAVTFSYDDGCRQDLRLAETLNSYGIKATFNINSGVLGKPDDWHLSAEEIQRNILDAGHEIANHGKYHMAPGLARSVDAIRDILDGRQELEQIFGRIVRGYAYPDTGILAMQNGASYENIRKNLQDLGVAYARTLGSDNNGFRLPSDWYSWMPTAHHANPNAIAWAQEFLALDVNGQYWSMRHPRLYYLWGHSYEFEGNWGLLEALCQTLGGHEEIWYATNGEIYDYVEAWDRLIFSADGRMVTNPTLRTVWFDEDGVLYTVHSGETIQLK